MPIVAVKPVPTAEIVEQILKFCSAYSGRVFYPYQAQFMRRVASSVIDNDGEEITALFSRQSGKTDSIACLVGGLAVILPFMARLPQYRHDTRLQRFKNGILIGIFAPILDQAQTTFDRIRGRLSCNEAEAVFSVPALGVRMDTNNGNCVGFSNGSSILCMSASEQSHIESKTFHLIIIEECVSKDSLIATPTGTAKISSLKAGDAVLGYKGSIVSDRVLNVWNRGNKKTYKVKFSDGAEVTATGNHPFYTSHGWVTPKQMMGVDLSSTLFCTIPCQEESYGQTINTGNAVGGRVIGLWGQEVFKVPTTEDTSLNKAEGVCRAQMEHTKGLMRLATEAHSELGSREMVDEAIHSLPPFPSSVLQYLLQEGEEGSDLGMGETANPSRDGLLVHGRRELNGSCEGNVYSHALLLQERECITSTGAEEVRHNPQNSSRQEDREMLLNVSRKRTEQVLPFGISIYDSKYAVQDAHIGASVVMPSVREKEGVNKTNTILLPEMLRGREVSGVKVLSVEEHGVEEVWDIETETGTFFANGVLVHNCQEVSNSKIRKSIHPMGASCVCAGSLVFNEKGERVPIEKFFGSKIIGAKLGKMSGLYTTNYDGSKNTNVSENSYIIDDVVWKGYTGIKQCVEVISNTGRVIRGSVDHPVVKKFRRSRGHGWVPLGELGLGDSIAVMDEVPVFGNKRMFDPRLVGMLIGDGSYRKGGMVRYCSCDEELLSYVKSKYEFKAYAIHRTKDGRMFEDGTIKGLCDELRALGIYGQVSRDKRLPVGIDKYDKKDLLEMLGGLYDTDGCVVVYGKRKATVYLDSISKEMLEEVRLTLDKMGVHGAVYKSKSRSGYSKKPSEVYRFCVSSKQSVERFHSLIRFNVGYKQNKLDQAVELLRGHKCKVQRSVKGMFFERVVSIRKLGLERVYNLTAKKEHTYLVNGFITHNTNASMVKIGTAYTSRNDFYDGIQRNKRKLNETGIKNHFEYDYTIAQKYNPLYAKYIEREMYRLGFDSDEFRMSYRLHWILERGMFISPEQLEKLGVDYNGKPYDIVEMRRNSHQVAGLDIAKASDSTVLTIMEVDYNNVSPEGFFYKRILNWLEIFGDDHESQFYQIKDFLANYNVEKMCVDATGMGDPVADRLTAALPNINIIPYSFNRSSKSDLYKYLLNDLSGGRIRFPNSPEMQKVRRQRKFVSQILDLEKSYVGEYLVCEHPDERDAHDDFPDSMALANWAAKEEGIAIMSQEPNSLW